MTAAEFARRMHAAASSRSPPDGSRRAGHDPVFDLLRDYDVSRWSFARFRFLGPETYSWRVLVGAVHLCPVYVDLGTGEVNTGQLGDLARLGWRCAESQAAFLDALDLVADFERQVALREWLAEHDASVIAQAASCADHAGGRQYLPFYRMLLGTLCH